jgi:precorrin-6B methylase 2
MPSLLEFHAFLLTDTGTRLDRFAKALAAAVRPGDTVLDLGAGSAILSILACRCGARRAYAVEDTDAVAFARALVAASPYCDRIEIIHARSFDVTLSERADVLVADVHSTFGLQEQGLSAMIDARTRLVRPGGRIVPARMQLCVAPAEAADLYDAKVNRWQHVVQGLDLAPIRDLAVNTIYPGRLAPSALLAPPASVCTIRFDTVTDQHISGQVQVRATRAGTLHGVCGGIVTTLGDRVEISNLPGDPGTSNFAHAFLPIDTPVAVAEGDGLEIQVDSYDGEELRWIVTITAANSGAGRRFTHSTFLSRALSPERLRKRDPNYRPVLGARAQIERDLLNRIDGTHTVADLEQWLAGHEGGRLARERLAEVLTTTIERCG